MQLNIFNKIIVVLILVCLIGVSVISAVNVLVGYFSWLDIIAGFLRIFTSVNRIVAFLALVAVFLFSIFLLLLEFYRRRKKVANISSSKSGSAMVTLETVSGQVRNEVLKIDGLDDIKVKVVPKKSGIIIDMNALLDESVDIPAKMQEITSRASGVVSDKLGIKVLKTNLTITGLSSKKKGKEENKTETEQMEIIEGSVKAEDIPGKEDTDR
jgi:uncharacterized alkaline shock family protein YloU